MDETGDCGSVAFLQNIQHPISVARKVMEETRHIMLVGKGAEEFAVKMGFERISPAYGKIGRALAKVESRKLGRWKSRNQRREPRHHWYGCP